MYGEIIFKCSFDILKGIFVWNLTDIHAAVATRVFTTTPTLNETKRTSLVRFIYEDLQ